MATAPLKYDDLLEEIDQLRTRLSEAECSLAALRAERGATRCVPLSQAGPSSMPEQDALCRSQSKQLSDLLESQAELLKNQRTLQLRAEELQTLLDTIPLGIFIAHDPACLSMTGNKSLREMLRLSADQNVSSTAPPDKRPTNYTVYKNGIPMVGGEMPAQRAARGGPTCFEELEIRFDDGTKKDVLVFAAPLFDADCSARGSVGGLLDITERKQIEDRLRLMNERFQVALKGSNIMVFNQDLQLRYTWVHDPILGTNTDQFLGKRDTEIFKRSEDAEVTEAIKRRVLDTGLSEHQEVCVFVEGEERFYDLRVDPTFSSDGVINGITCAAIDVTDRKLIETSLKESDRQKNEFLATLAHELRNPLAPLRNGLQVMEIACDDAMLLQEVRVMMNRQLHQLTRLVDDLLDMSRISQGKITLELKPTRLEDVIQSAMETCKPLIDEMGHSVTLSLAGSPIYVKADFTRLSQVFVNLLNNATKYSEPRSRIDLTTRADANQVIVEVQDTGVGIRQEELERVFEMFSQVDEARSRSKGGLGIGLSLVRRLVEMHDGRVEARSEGPGCGSTFTVYLPLLRYTPSHPQTNMPARSSNKFRILVVDDNQDNAKSLAIVLKASGHTVETAFDGEQALEAYRETSPDFILLDIGLPKMDGHSVCRTIRQEMKDEKVFIIAQSGWGQDQDRKLSCAAGFDDHLVKPVNLQSLFELMTNLWVSRKLTS